MARNLRTLGANHNIWCMKLNQYVNSKDQLAPPAKSYRECELGKWLYTEGQQLLGLRSEIKTLETVHQELHSLSKKIIELKQAGNINEARQNLFPLQDKSDKIIEILHKIQAKMVTA